VAEEIRLSAEKEDAGARLDIFLSQRLRMTRSAAANLIEKGSVLVDSAERRPSFRLKQGMTVQVLIEQKEEPDTLKAYDLPLDILYEDQWIIVINKPAGLVVHPGAGNTDQTLVNALISRYPDISGVGDKDRPGIVHRIDKLTSGVMVVARDPEAHAVLARAFKEHEHKRVYQAVCYGHMKEQTGRIETLLGRHPADRKRMSSKVKSGRQAITDWKVIAEWPQMSLLELGLLTGRTHQIRVHLSDIGHPVVADPQYGGRKRANSIADPLVRSYVKSVGRQMLHAYKLGIVHPSTGEKMEFTAEMPDDMKRLIEMLDEEIRR